jgi:DNA polymerase-3 subunit gamma/tau
MALIRLLQSEPALPIDLLIDKLDDLRREIRGGDPLPAVAAPQAAAPSGRSQRQPSTGQTPPEAALSVAPTVSPAAGPAQPSVSGWSQIIDVIARQNPSLAANLAKCKINKTAGDSVEIELPDNGFTLKMIERDKNMALLKQVCADVLGRPVDIQLATQTTMDGNRRKKKKDHRLKQKALSHPLVADAIEIFDGNLIDVKIL